MTNYCQSYVRYVYVLQIRTVVLMACFPTFMPVSVVPYLTFLTYRSYIVLCVSHSSYTVLYSSCSTVWHSYHTVLSYFSSVFQHFTDCSICFKAQFLSWTSLLLSLSLPFVCQFAPPSEPPHSSFTDISDLLPSLSIITCSSLYLYTLPVSFSLSVNIIYPYNLPCSYDYRTLSFLDFFFFYYFMVGYSFSLQYRISYLLSSYIRYLVFSLNLHLSLVLSLSLHIRSTVSFLVRYR